MITNMVRQSEIAAMRERSISLIQKLAMRKDFPTARLVIGRVNFYDLEEVLEFFDNRAKRRR